MKRLRKKVAARVCPNVSVCSERVNNVTGSFSLDVHKMPGMDMGLSLTLSADQGGRQSVMVSGVTAASVADR